MPERYLAPVAGRVVVGRCHPLTQCYLCGPTSPQRRTASLLSSVA